MFSVNTRSITPRVPASSRICRLKNWNDGVTTVCPPTPGAARAIGILPKNPEPGNY
jgi:hypothetical protein